MEMAAGSIKSVFKGARGRGGGWGGGESDERKAGRVKFASRKLFLAGGTLSSFHPRA